MARYYACLSREDERTISGGTGDPERCHEKLIKAFAKTEADGFCAVTGDVEVARARVTDRQSTLAADLLLENATAPDPAECAGLQLRAAARYAKCIAGRRSGWLQGGIVEPVYARYEWYGADSCDYAVGNTFDRVHSLAGGTTCPFSGPYFLDEVQSSVEYFASYLPSAEFPDKLIRNVSFPFGALAGSDFSNSELHRTHFDDADLSNSNWAGTRLETCHFDRANLAGVDFSSSNFYRITAGFLAACPAALPTDWVCAGDDLLGPYVVAAGYDLSGADLQGLNLVSAQFVGANLSGADLRGADLSGARLDGSDFSGTDMRGADMGGFEMNGATFDGANLAGLDWSRFYSDQYRVERFSAKNLIACPAILESQFTCTDGSILGPYANFDGLNLSGKDFHGRFFSSASMRGTNLTGADLSNADLGGADFTGADLTGANLAMADLGGFYQTTWSGTTCPDGMLSDDVGGTCCGHHVGSPPSDCPP